MTSQAPKPGLRHHTPHSGKFALQSPVPLRPSAPPPPGTYLDRCQHGLAALSQALLRPQETNAYTELAAFLFESWGEHEVPRQAPYPSNIGDDHSPFEYSLAFDPEGVELRLLFESQSEPATPAANQAAALELSRRIARRYALDFRRFDLIQDLFLTSSPSADFSLWHAVCLNPGKPPAFKIYLNPQVRGADAATSVMEEALGRLGFGAKTIAATRQAIKRPGLDALGYFSLDLADGPDARVKVYVAHPLIDAAELDTIFELCPAHRPGDVIDFCEAISGSRATFARKPLMSCMSFVSGSELPKAMTLHLPIAHYVDTDAIAAERSEAFLRGAGLDHAAYRRSMSTIASRPLHETLGVQSYASYRREKGGLRFTAYLSPALFQR